MTKEKYKQIRLNPEIRMKLDSYKMDGESYSIAIGRLFKENELLKDSQEKLMKIAMKTPDSISLPTVNHKTIFAIMEILGMEGDDEDKIAKLKIYLKPLLMENPDAVYSCIQSIKEEYGEFGPILDKLSSGIKESYEL